jgi:hypothetical protein
MFNLQDVEIRRKKNVKRGRPTTTTTAAATTTAATINHLSKTKPAGENEIFFTIRS